MALKIQQQSFLQHPRDGHYHFCWHVARHKSIMWSKWKKALKHNGKPPHHMKQIIIHLVGVTSGTVHAWSHNQSSRAAVGPRCSMDREAMASQWSWITCTLPSHNQHAPTKWKETIFQFYMGDRVCTEHAPRAPGEKAPEDTRETTGRADQAHMPCSHLQEKRKVGTRLWAALNTHHRIWLLILFATPWHIQSIVE